MSRRSFTGPPHGGSGEAFDEHADRYDAWYDASVGRAVFGTELACLRPLTDLLPRPRLEVGVGTGRFAQALEVEYGVDPSSRMLAAARKRGIRTVQGIGERLPFRSSSCGGVLMAFTICFVRDPASVLDEIRRVLRPGGGLVIGFLPRGAAWAQMYDRRGAEGHPIYEAARFYATEEVEDFIHQAGMQIAGRRSALFQPPGLDAYVAEEPVDGYRGNASFLAVSGRT